MKHGLCAAVACIALLMACPAAMASADISDMSLEDLYVLREAVDAQISLLESEDGVHVYESGSYLVGRDMPAGDYAVIENEDAVFASVIVRADDSVDAERIAYGLVNRQVMIHFNDDTWVTISEASAYPMEEAPVKGLENDVAGEGAYLVGMQIPAGKYVVSTLEKAPLSSYSVYDGIMGTEASLVKFEVLHDDVSIDLADGQYIELSGCMMTKAD